MRKILLVFLLLFLLLIFSGSNCRTRRRQKQEFADDSFIIAISSNYKYKYRSFTLEDFNYDNVDYFYCMFWSDDYNEGYISIHLKKIGMDEVEKAMDHFEKLEFVKWCEKNGITYIM